jgi:hypothetical protein
MKPTERQVVVHTKTIDGYEYISHFEWKPEGFFDPTIPRYTIWDISVKPKDA